MLVPQMRPLETADKIHPRLQRIRPRIAALLEIDDPTELDAALEEIQTLLYRCGYHLDLAHTKRHWQLERRKKARRSAHKDSVPTRRGRRPGSANWAARQLGLGLAILWMGQTGRRPTRRTDPYDDGREYGPYRDFVVCVAGAVPRILRMRGDGHVPQVDYLVRESLKELAAAQNAPEEARRRGLLAESSWHRLES